MAGKIVLGKGLASLIPTNPTELLSHTLNDEKKDVKRHAAEEGPVLVAISEIITSKNQPRKIFKEKELTELAQSIKENGIIQPLIVSKAERGFELIAGERRLRAAKKAGLERVPVVIKNVTDRDKMIISIIENVQRDDLNCVEEALAYYQLMEEYKLTQEEVAKKMGKERSTVANFLRILKLPRNVVDMLQKEILSFGHAKVLAAIKEREDIERYANAAASQELSVRELELLIKKGIRSKPVRTENRVDVETDSLRVQLENRTGFHFLIKNKKNGAGEVTIKFNNEAEFNDVYKFLMSI